MDILKPMMAAVGSMEPMQMIVMVIILAAIMMGWYYLTKIRPREMDRQEAHDNRMLEIEDRRSRDQESTNTYLREASNSQQVLLTQNTEAVKDLKEIMRIMSETFKKYLRSCRSMTRIVRKPTRRSKRSTAACRRKMMSVKYIRMYARSSTTWPARKIPTPS